MPFSNSTAAGFGLLVMHAMDIYRTHMEVPPAAPPDAWLEARGWTLIGTLHARDTAFPKGVKSTIQVLDHETCYGYLARHAGDNQLVAAVRGTDGLVEWLEDGDFVPVAYAPLAQHPSAGPLERVEQGFWDIYASMTLHDLDGTSQGSAGAAILKFLLAGAPSITVVGHSLGSALATYLTLDLALAAPDPASVQACLFASPRTGNAAFVQVFDQTVPGYRLFNYALDLVPQLPYGPDYATLPRCTIIQPATAEARIRLSLGCNHHVICYCAMLDYEGTMDIVKSPPDGEGNSALCVLGPETGTPSLAKTLVNVLAKVV